MLYYKVRLLVNHSGFCLKSHFFLFNTHDCTSVWQHPPLMSQTLRTDLELHLVLQQCCFFPLQIMTFPKSLPFIDLVRFRKTYSCFTSGSANFWYIHSIQFTEDINCFGLTALLKTTLPAGYNTAKEIQPPFCIQAACLDQCIWWPCNPMSSNNSLRNKSALPAYTHFCPWLQPAEGNTWLAGGSSGSSPRWAQWGWCGCGSGCPGPHWPALVCEQSSRTGWWLRQRHEPPAWHCWNWDHAGSCSRMQSQWLEREHEMFVTVNGIIQRAASYTATHTTCMT